MTFFRSGKFSLSSAAMKVAASALSSDLTGYDALMAALRHENPKPFTVPLRGNPVHSVSLDQPLIWIFGALGSGKTEATISMMKDATRSGYRTVSTSTHNGVLNRWRSEERFAIDLNKVEADPDAVCGALRLAKVIFSGNTATHLGILLPNLHKALPEMIQNLIPALAELFTLVDAETRLVFSDPGLGVSDLLCIVSPLREAAVKSGSQVVIETSSPPQALVSCVMPEDAQLIMYIPDTGDREISRLKEGEGILRIGEKILDVQMKYERLELTDDFLIPPSHDRFIHEIAAKIDARMQFSPPICHIGRLDLVARACGYRSWHAAQGRKSGN